MCVDNLSWKIPVSLIISMNMQGMSNEPMKLFENLKQKTKAKMK